MLMCNNAYSQLFKQLLQIYIIAEKHYCDPDSSGS